MKPQGHTARETFLPDFCQARTVFVVVVLAELLAIVLSLSAPPGALSLTLQLALTSLFVQWVALGSTAILCLLRSRLTGLSDSRVAAVSYSTALAVTLFLAELAWYFLNRGSLAVGWTPPHLWFLGRTMIISGIVWALALRYFYVRHQWRLRMRSEAEARYEALQARIKPHFLFNSLNTITGLIRRSPAIAEEAVGDLADLFRASLRDNRRDWTLAEELELGRRYLRIEQLRLGSRLAVEWHLEAPARTVSPRAVSATPDRECHLSWH